MAESLRGRLHRLLARRALCKRWPDPDTSHIRYTAEPQEISLVDLPCLPDATFEVVKDGVVEKRAFAARAEAGAEPLSPAEAGAIEQREAAWPQAASAAAATEKPTAPAESGAPSNAAEALAKAAGALAEAAQKLERAADENGRLRKALDEVSPALADLAQRVARLEAQPLPAKAALRSVAKSADGEAEAFGADEAVRRLAALPAPERALALTKLSLANPLRF